MNQSFCLFALLSLFIVDSTGTATSSSESSESTLTPTTTTVHNNYQLCFKLKDLRLSNLDYHSRNSVYGVPSGQIHLFDPSLRHPSIRSVDLPLSMSNDPNVTTYNYNDLNVKLCWINTLSTQLYFDFEIFQFYHVAMRVGFPLSTGLNGSGLEKKDFKNKESLNMTSSKSAEYRKVLVSITYEFELNILSKKEYQSLLNGTTGIDGSLSSLQAAARLDSSDDSKDSLDSSSSDFVQAEDEFSELSREGSVVEHHKSSKSSSNSSSNNVGMIFSAVVAALVGFGVLVGVIIYLVRMYSRKDYDDVDKQSKNNKNNNNNKNEFYDEVKDGIKGKLRRISLRDTKDKLSKIKESITTKASISLQTENPEKYETIGDPNDNDNNNNEREKSRSNSRTKEHNSDDDSGSSIDVSIVTNESIPLP